MNSCLTESSVFTVCILCTQLNAITLGLERAVSKGQNINNFLYLLTTLSVYYFGYFNRGHT